MKHSYYHTCPTCGASLDPGERCEDCNPRDKVVYPNAGRYKSVEELMRKVVKQDANSQTSVCTKGV